MTRDEIIAKMRVELEERGVLTSRPNQTAWEKLGLLRYKHCVVCGAVCVLLIAINFRQNETTPHLPTEAI